MKTTRLLRGANRAISAASQDVLAVSLRRIETLAGPLEEITARKPREPIEAALVGETAGMIADEATRMRAALLPQCATTARKKRNLRDAE